MGEYISREAAIKEVYRFDGYLDDDLEWRLHYALKRLPAADVVEVVRCRECANWQSGWTPSNAKDGTHFCANVGLCTPSDWYCADGERKDGGQDDV